MAIAIFYLLKGAHSLNPKPLIVVSIFFPIIPIQPQYTPVFY